ncbi:MAG TPA: FAA hydrolase family protein [Rhodospirillales bacterium]|nr:FAA hydrolase family protein [Rhodospirillales bacterium]
MRYLFPPPPVVSVAVAGSDARFPVRRIFCVGRNYAAHAREMGGDPEREPPFFFTKPRDAVVEDGSEIPYPPLTRELHHEAELVVAIGRGGFAIAEEEALAHVFGYAAGIDLTRRDLQRALRAEGRPWDWAKGFDHSAPVGPIRRANEIGHPERGRITLAVDGEIRQDQDIADMIWRVPEILAHLSRAVRIAPGDLLFTGTPAGVGPLEIGNRVEVRIEGVGSCTVRIAAPEGAVAST